MKLFFSISYLFCVTVVLAQPKTDSMPKKNTTDFYKNYSNYILKSKSNKPRKTIDSSLYLTNNRDSSYKKSTIKTNLKSKNIQGTITPGKTFVEIKPVPEEEKREIITSTSQKEIQQQIASKNSVIAILDTSKKITPKISIDSLVYTTYKPVQNNRSNIKTNLKSKNISGTILPGKKGKIIQPEEVVLEHKNETTVSDSGPVKVISKKKEPISFKPNVIVVDSSINYPRKAASNYHATIQNDLRAQEITGTLVPEKKAILIEPKKDNSTNKVVTPKTNSVKSDVTLIEKADTIVPEKKVDLTQTKNDPFSLYSSPENNTGTSKFITNNNLKNSTDPVGKYSSPDESQQKEFENQNQTKKRNDLISKYTTPDEEQKKGSENQNSVTKKSDIISRYTTPDQDNGNHFSETNSEAPHLLFDPLVNYTTPFIKTNLKPVLLNTDTTFTAKKGVSFLFQPAVVDSVKGQKDSANIASVQNTNTANSENKETEKNEDATEETKSTSPSNPDSLFLVGASAGKSFSKPVNADSAFLVGSDIQSSISPFKTNYSNNPAISNNLQFNFLLNQYGKFSVVFTNASFFATLNQNGTISDYAIFYNGNIFSGKVDNKPLQVDNIRVSYNFRGLIDSIAGVPLHYTYDGKVNSFGNTIITYGSDGLIQQVGNYATKYNAIKKIEKVGMYRVGYNKQGLVIGVDDSQGLIVFKPVIANY